MKEREEEEEVRGRVGREEIKQDFEAVSSRSDLTYGPWRGGEEREGTCTQAEVRPWRLLADGDDEG